MPPAHFIPQKSGAHRIACIALYRALLNQCSRIPLPPEYFARGPINPIKHLIRKKFKQNQDVTSHQRIVKILKTGYATQMWKDYGNRRLIDTQYEALLRSTANDDPTSKFQLFSLLTTIQNEAQIASATIPNPPKKPLARPARPVAIPGAPKVLDIRPLPLSEIKGGIRHPPTIIFPSNGLLATLKFKKEVPSYVVRVIRQKDERRIQLSDRLQLLDVLLMEVEYEEEWEELVMDVAEEEGKVRATETEVWGFWRNELGATLADTKKIFSRFIRAAKRDGKRMMEIVEQERELALKERKERKHMKNEKRWAAKKEMWARGVEKGQETMSDTKEEERKKLKSDTEIGEEPRWTMKKRL
ncbi:hypothetical protein HYFRA_00011603 [Hymenoscyphus fraxineus]|uniref:Complex 1 LYR protein domain-containing protein n=1 Tax=Hymenoscyphus fraxineus TaxID=746836 RepID=A0A9N9PLS1_9HELO|nr:hypothetical protein HYFRA_00011603 [Hymenoscyphus fraxineus]